MEIEIVQKNNLSEDYLVNLVNFLEAENKTFLLVKYNLGEEDVSFKKDISGRWKKKVINSAIYNKKEGFENYSNYSAGILTSILSNYETEEQQSKNILICKDSFEIISENELERNLAISEAEQYSLQPIQLNEDELENMLGRKSGYISPVLDQNKIKNLNAIYFSEKLLNLSNNKVLYDIPMQLDKKGNEITLLANPLDVFEILKFTNDIYVGNNLEQIMKKEVNL